MNAQGTRVYWRPPDWKPPSQRDPDATPPDLSRGLCVGADRNLAEWFHPPGDSPAGRGIAALTIATYCNPCPVREPCRRWGLRVGKGTGIWGGLWLDDMRRQGQQS